MSTIDYYLFPLSPFSYLAGLRLEAVAALAGAQIAYKPFDLFRVFRETGTALPKDRHPSRQKYRLQDLARAARLNGLPLNLQPRHWPTNPVPASAAIIAAEAEGGGETGRLVHALLRAVWAEDRNIAEEAVIGECLAEAGFDPGIAAKGLLAGVERLERNTDEALKAGVFGAPSYVVAGEVFWGQDRLPHLAALLNADAGG
ncbi:2-hydroxychromene-2-carboxylate isomerase [soil metagenome]